MSSRQDALLAGGLVIGFLLVYLRTLCPTVYVGDTGEIATAIATGGVIHPPGYPLFSLLGRLALRLVPIGEPAFRIGCMVALAAAGVVGVLYLLGRALRCAPWAAATGAAAFGASYTFWTQSTLVEVYTLHVLLVCLTLLGAVSYRRSGRTGHLALAVLAFSLGLAHHLTMVHTAPALLLLCGRRLRLHLRVNWRVAAVGALLLVGPALYGLLIVWAHSDSVQIWGRPVNLRLLWTHASASFYRSYMGIPGGAELWAGLTQAGQLYRDNFPFITFLLPLVGLAILWVRDRGTAGGLLLLIAVVAAFNQCYRIWDIQAYYLPIWAAAAVLLAVALDGAARCLGSHRTRAVVCGVLFCLFLGGSLLRNWTACDLSRATWMREYAQTMLENTDRNGVLLVHSDCNTFATWYLQDVLGIRRDVITIEPGVLSEVWLSHDKDPSMWYLHRLRRQGVPLRIPERVPAEPEARRQLALHGYLIQLLEGTLRDRPIFLWFAPLHEPLSADPQPILRWAEERFRPVQQGIIVRLQPKSQAENAAEALRTNERLWKQIALPKLPTVRTEEEPKIAAAISHYGVMLVYLGMLYERTGDLRGAEETYRRAIAWAPDLRPAKIALTAVRKTLEERALGSP